MTLSTDTHNALRLIDALEQERDTLREEGNHVAAEAITAFFTHAQADSYKRLYALLSAKKD